MQDPVYTFSQEFTIWDEAVARGQLTMHFETGYNAFAFRHRLNKARSAYRKYQAWLQQNTEEQPDGASVLFGGLSATGKIVTPYDGLTCVIEQEDKVGKGITMDRPTTLTISRKLGKAVGVVKITDPETGEELEL